MLAATQRLLLPSAVTNERQGHQPPSDAAAATMEFNGKRQLQSQDEAARTEVETPPARPRQLHSDAAAATMEFNGKRQLQSQQGAARTEVETPPARPRQLHS